MATAKKTTAKTTAATAKGGHIVKMRLPRMKLPGKDMELVVKDGADLVIGTLRVSRGGLDWYPKSAKIPRRWTWEQFAALMESAEKG